MASQRRSIWEIRFLALQQFICYRKEGIHHIAARKALGENGLNPDEKEIMVLEYEVFNKVHNESRRLENLPANRVWLQRDN